MLCGVPLTAHAAEDETAAKTQETEVVCDKECKEMRAGHDWAIKNKIKDPTLCKNHSPLFQQSCESVLRRESGALKRKNDIEHIKEREKRRKAAPAKKP